MPLQSTPLAIACSALGILSCKVGAQEFIGVTFHRNLYSYNATTGAATLLKSNVVPFAPNSMTSWGGQIFIGQGYDVHVLSNADWAATLIISLSNTAAGSIRGLAAHPVSGDIYVATLNESAGGQLPVLHKWNRLNNSIAYIGSLSLRSVQAIEFNRRGELYAWEMTTGNLQGQQGRGLIRINEATAEITDVSPTTFAPGSTSSQVSVQSLAFDMSGNTYVASQTAILLAGENDALTQLANYIGSTASDFRGFVIKPTPFSVWQGSAFPASLSDTSVQPASDPDRDGIINYVEYALGTSPAIGSSSPAPSVAMIETRRHLQIEWTRPAGRTGVSVTGETTLSPDQLEWSTGASFVETIIFPTGGGNERVIVRDAAPMNGIESRRFLRLRFQMQ
jgi:hypothetical protein